jgi:hypothetical protein
MKLCEKKVNSIFHESSDVVIQRFPTVRGEAVIVYIDGLADKDLMDRDIIEPLKSESFDGDVPKAIRVTSCSGLRI